MHSKVNWNIVAQILSSDWKETKKNQKTAWICKIGDNKYDIEMDLHILSYIIILTDLIRIPFAFLQALHQELCYSVHLSLPAVLVPLKGFNCANLAHHINASITDTHVQQVRN